MIAFIDEHRAVHGVEPICKVDLVSFAGGVDWCVKLP